MNWRAIGIWIGLPAAAWAGLIAVIAALDFLGVRPVISRELKATEVQIAANTRAVQLIRWQVLNAKRQNQGLTASELVEFCELSRALGLRGAGCA